MPTKLHVRTILLLVLSGFIVLFISSGVAGIFMLKSTQRTISDLGRHGIEQANRLSDATLALFLGRVALINAKTYMEGGLEEQRDEALAQAGTLLERSATAFGQFHQSLQAEADSPPAGQPALVQHYHALLDDTLHPLSTALRSWNGIEANRIVDQAMEPATNTFLASLEAFQQRNRTMAQQGIQHANHISFRAIQALSLVLALSLLMAFGIHRIFRKALLRPLNGLLSHFNTMATGDLRPQLPSGGTTEIGRLQEGVRHMQASLVRTVASMQDEANAMYTDTNDIAQRNRQISTQIDAQAQALDQAALAIDTLEKNVAQSSRHATEATELAQEAQATASLGHTAVSEVISSMGEISSCAKHISTIVQLINGIATQTNLLALNAAVEAARAGVHGRGFAVVANEVRELAHRSSQAANDIKELIAASDQSVAAGTMQVRQAGQAMDAILTAVASVNQRIAWIAQASAQQTQDIAEVKCAVGSVRQNAQANLDLVQQTGNATMALSEQALRLHAIASDFRFSGDAAQPQQPASDTEASAHIVLLSATA